VSRKSRRSCQINVVKPALGMMSLIALISNQSSIHFHPPHHQSCTRRVFLFCFAHGGGNNLSSGGGGGDSHG
jgi:hypothetical protein